MLALIIGSIFAISYFLFASLGLYEANDEVEVVVVIDRPATPPPEPPPLPPSPLPDPQPDSEPLPIPIPEPPSALDYSHLVGIWMQTPEIFFVFFDNTDYIELVYIRGNEIEFGTLTMLDDGVFLTEYEFTPGALCTYVLNGNELIVTNEQGFNFYLTRINSIPIDFSQFYNSDEFNTDDFIVDKRLVGNWAFVGGVPIAPRTSLFAAGFEYFEDGRVVSEIGYEFSWLWLMLPDEKWSIETNEHGEVYFYLIYNLREETGSLIFISEYGIFGFRRVD